MIQQKQFAGGLLALGISIALQASVSAATDTPSTSWLMSEAEMAAHKAAMARLEGQARDEYRNAQYEQLKQRAQEHGFKLPEHPPWTQQASNPALAAEDADAAAAAARHAEMRDKLQARREAMQKASEANLARLQEAAIAQQQQVEAQLQADRQQLTQDAPQPEPAAEVPPATEPAAETVAAPTVPVTEASPAPVAMSPTPPALEGPPAAAAESPAAPVAEAPAAITPPQAPTPPAAPIPAARVQAAAGPSPRFAPVEQTAVPTPPAVQPPVQLQAGATPEPAPEAGVAGQSPDAMTAYRENMRTRFDEYMQERQLQLEENARRQREQHEAVMEKNRALRTNRGPYPPYPYPAAPPSYGPRYPAAYPGYRTPYWQQ